MPTIRTIHNKSTRYYHHSKPQQNAQENSISTLHFVTAVTPSDKSMATAFINEANSNTEAEIMIDSGAATHVCPPWLATHPPLYALQQGQGPNLRTATDEEINMYTDTNGYWWPTTTTTRCPTLLCVWHETTHYVSNTTDGTRVWHTVQRHANNVTQQRFSFQLGKKSWTVHDWNNKISSNHTSGSSQKQERYLDIQNTRFPGQNTQVNTQSTLCARQQVSNTNRQTWELQKDHCPQTKWQRGRLWRQVPRSQQVTTEKSSARTNMDRRNMVQSEERNKSSWQHTTTATSNTITKTQGTRSNNDISIISTTADDKTYIQETNWEHTTTASASTHISNFDSTSQRCSTNIRLLGQRRQHAETSTYPTTKGFVHTTTNRWWTRCYQTDSTKKIHHQTHRWNKRVFSK